MRPGRGVSARVWCWSRSRRCELMPKQRYLYDVFLIHHRDDKARVEELAHRLEAVGIKAFPDSCQLARGHHWQRDLEATLARSRTYAVIVGAGGLGAWAKQELLLAQDRLVADDTLRVILVLLAGARKPELPQFLRQRTWVEFGSEPPDEEDLQRLVRTIRDPSEISKLDQEYRSIIESAAGGVSSLEEVEDLLRRLKRLRLTLHHLRRRISADEEEILDGLRHSVDRNLDQLKKAREVDRFNVLATEFGDLMDSAKGGIRDKDELRRFAEALSRINERTRRLRSGAISMASRRHVDELLQALDHVTAQVDDAAQVVAAAREAPPKPRRKFLDWLRGRKQAIPREATQAQKPHKTIGRRPFRGWTQRSAPSWDQVDCTVFAPPNARVSSSVMVQVFAHLPEETGEARELAREFDGTTQRRGRTSLATYIQQGSRLTFDLKLPGLKVVEPSQELTWRGRSESAQFAVSIPALFPLGTIIGKVLVSQNTVPIGQIQFKLDVVGDADKVVTRKVKSGNAMRYGLAFISYASEDRNEVMRRVQMLDAVGIRYFQDLLDLDPGDRWAQKLYQRIDESDVLFLFWSTAARNSRWVRREWKYCIEHKGEDFICPLMIEGPPFPPPPPELAHIHFGGKLQYFIQHQ